jgi:hypothetical protein
MPYDDAEPDDPQVLVGVGLPADAAASREMAAAFADEFAQIGFDRDRLLRLFTNPFYAGAYAARLLLGDTAIARLVDESLRAYGGRTVEVVDAPGGDEAAAPESLRGKRALRVLQAGEG